MEGGVETKSRFLDLDCRDKLFEIVEIFSTVETYYLPVSRQIETPRLRANTKNIQSVSKLIMKIDKV
jgi:hypothetical protein